MRSFVLAGRSLFCVLCSRFEERVLKLGFECQFTDLTGDVSLASPLDRITLDGGVRLTLRVVFIRTLAVSVVVVKLREEREGGVIAIRTCAKSKLARPRRRPSFALNVRMVTSAALIGSVTDPICPRAYIPDRLPTTPTTARFRTRR
jgi:hypothetical protein